MKQWIVNHKFEVLCLLVLLGAAIYSIAAPAPATPELDALVDTKAELAGIVIRDPDVRERSVFLTVRTDSGTVLVRADRYGSYAYGDKVSVVGKVELPQEFDTDSGRTFDYPMYLRAQGISHTVSFAQVSVISHAQGSPIVAGLLDIKHWFVRGIQSALPEPESSLLAGLLVGEKRGLGEHLTDLFRKAGVIHIIVLSGYNVALVIEWLRKFFHAFLPRNIALALSGLGAIAFMIMTGASETAIRATAMALVVLVAKALYRPAEGLRILLFVAALMAVWNPYLVLFDLSYQLSILATLGLILWSEHFIPYFTWMRNKTLIEIASTTTATQLAVLPLLIISVGQVSVVGFVSNLAVLVAVPFAMGWGFVMALVASASTTLALPLTFVTYVLLHYIILASSFLGALPFAAVLI